jgi:hypothetical protein
MDSAGGPDAKKARWSPNSFSGVNGLGNGVAARDAFANYGYGPQASISQSGFNNHSPSNAFSANPLYSTPSLSINTAATGNGMSGQMSPNTAGPFTPQTQQAQSANGNGYSGFGGYNMLAMGMPGMGVLNGFYGNQMGNFNQVSKPLVSCSAAMAQSSTAGLLAATPPPTYDSNTHCRALFASYPLGSCGGSR